MTPIVVSGHFEIQDGGQSRNGKKCHHEIYCTGLVNLSQKYFPFKGKKITNQNFATIRHLLIQCLNIKRQTPKSHNYIKNETMH